MSLDSDNSCVLLSSRGSRTSCVFQNEDEKDEIPGVGEESVLEMLSCSKFSDLETWLCMPSSLLLPRNLDSTCSSSSSSHNSSSSHASQPASSSSSSSSPASQRSTCSDPGEMPPRSSDVDPPLLTSSLGGEMLLSPLLSSTPHRGVRKRRRIAANPGGLHWTSTGSVQRDFWSPDPSPSRGVRSPPLLFLPV
ncbi:hypothetical protein OYC64_004070 [Pagothenia borchgrevinki]|uniref:Uncharacterized protein n=1 Tax=Pagothenia borchgrevinki TaxID=8213 RepID=A0ABD2FX28_PAGBO